MKAQKRLSAQIMKCSPKRIVFDSPHLEEIKEAITKADIKELIKSKAITRKPAKGISTVRKRKKDAQKRKGRMKGAGARKGKRTARLRRKDAWKNRIRLQRKFLKCLRKKSRINRKEYRKLYRKTKGGFFRSRRHLKLLIGEQK